MAIIKRVLIHHHATVYTDPFTGERFTYSFIGRWVNEISRQKDIVGLLFHSTDIKSKKHDTPLTGSNIVLESLGAPGKGFDRFQKMKRLKLACKSVNGKYDALIIRGITPRQFSVFRFVDVPNKFYLLVSSLVDSKPKFIFTKQDLYFYIMFYIRKWEIGEISRKANMMANSPKIVKELWSEFGSVGTFVPTNTLSNKEIRSFSPPSIPKAPVLFFCGRMVKDKGIFELLESLDILHKRGIFAKLVFTGETNELLLNQFHALPYWSNILDYVSFTGFVNFGEHLLDMYAQSDIYILPSYHEGFPHSIWEAAAVSTPVITTAVGGIPGILTEKEVWFIPVYQAEAIAEKVMELMKSPNMVIEKSKALYDLVQLNSVEAGVDKLVSIMNNFGE